MTKVLSEIEVLSFVCNKLEEANVAYMLTGSLASNFYAVPRMTRDIDIVIELKSTDIDHLCEILEKDFYFEKSAVQEAVQRRSMFNIIHNDSVCKIDFIIRKNVDYRKTEFLRKKQINVDGTLVWIVAPEDLIISKLFWAKDSISEMQIKDIQNILKSVHDLDQSYLEMWIDKLDLVSIYKKVASNG